MEPGNKKLLTQVILFIIVFAVAFFVTRLVLKK